MGEEAEMHSRRWLIEQLRDRPLMFGVGGSFVEYAAYLHGYQHGGAGRWLDDFRLWLAHGLDLETNLGWPSYLLRLTFPDRSGSWDFRAERTEAEEAAACSALSTGC